MKTTLLYIRSFVCMITISVITWSCDSMVEVDPPSDVLSTELTFSTKEGIRAAEKGLYTDNWLSCSVYYNYLSTYYSMFSDDMIYRTTSYADYYENTYTPSSSIIPTVWSRLYEAIYNSNDFIEHVDGSNLLDAEERDTYIGEALFFRALPYFILTSSFGDVPLVLSTYYQENATLPRTPQDDIYAQVIDDLTKAASLIKNSDKGVVYITADACYALLARTYLYTGQWQQAIDTANKLLPVIDGGQNSHYQLEQIDNVFKQSSKESIMAVNMEGYSGSGTYQGYTREGNSFVPSGNNVNYQLTESLVNEILSDEDDMRKNWIGVKKKGNATYYYPYKYKNRATPASTDDYEYQSWFRLAEQYLIRAEAETQLGNLTAAANDINKIRNRAGISSINPTGMSKNDMMWAVSQERQKEFFSELGHRWFDLRRMGFIDQVLGQCSWKQWKTYKALFPIPEAEINSNPNLTQNPGYDTITQ